MRGIRIVSSFCILRIKLLWAYLSKYGSGMLEHLLRICPGVVYLGFEIDLVFWGNVKLISKVVSLYSWPQWRSVLLAPHLLQHILSLEVFILVILKGVKWNLRIAKGGFWDKGMNSSKIVPLSDTTEPYHQLLFQCYLEYQWDEHLSWNSYYRLVFLECEYSVCI